VAGWWTEEHARARACGRARDTGSACEKERESGREEERVINLV
jgi:hypothetical protein